MTVKYIYTPIEEQIKKFYKRFGLVHGKKAYDILSKTPNTRDYMTKYFRNVFDYSTVFYVIDDIDTLFVYNDRSFYHNRGGFLVKYRSVESRSEEEWYVKPLPIPDLALSVKEFDSDTLQPSGRIVYGKNDHYSDVFDLVSNCATDLDVWKAIKGKFLKIVDSKTVIYPKFNRCNEIERTGEGKVPVFTFVNNCDLGTVPPWYYCYKDYLIFLDNRTQKFGIRNVNTGKIIVESVFDKILFGNNSSDNTYSCLNEGANVDGVDKSSISSNIEYVRFYKDGKKAIFRISELANLQKK